MAKRDRGPLASLIAVIGEQVLVRDLSEAEVSDAVQAKSDQPEQVRNLDRFTQWLHARSSGVSQQANYWSSAQPSDVVSAKYLLYPGPSPR